jgi:hypothetical protein
VERVSFGDNRPNPGFVNINMACKVLLDQMAFQNPRDAVERVGMECFSGAIFKA